MSLTEGVGNIFFFGADSVRVGISTGVCKMSRKLDWNLVHDEDLISFC